MESQHLVLTGVSPEDGPTIIFPIILIHALLDSKKTWDALARRISVTTERVVWYLDCRNHGESIWTEDFTLKLLVKDIKLILSERKREKAIIVGSGMGGLVAMKLALESPEMVEKLIVEDMVPDPYPVRGWAVVVPTIKVLQSALGDIPEGADRITAKAAISNYILKHLNFPHMDSNPNHEFGLDTMPLKEVNGKYVWEANLRGIERALKNNALDINLLGQYDGEVLFLYGRNLFVKMREDKKIDSLFPRAVRIPVYGASRMTHFEKPEEFMKYVVKFIMGQLLSN